MPNLTLIETIDETMLLIQGIKTEILNSGDDILINASIGEGVARFIQICADVDDENEEAFNLHLQAISTLVDTIAEEDLATKGLMPNAQVQSVNMSVVI